MKRSKLHAYLLMSRLSNLPTVWSNILAGMALAGMISDGVWLLALSLSLFYIAGMLLNDAWDAKIDKKQRPERPIPRGEVSQREVYLIGFALLIVANSLLFWLTTADTIPLAGLLLTLAILAYTFSHKWFALSPVLMALCRFCVYLLAFLWISPHELHESFWYAALLLASYIIGITYFARQETQPQITFRWPLIFLAAPVLYGWQKIFPSFPYLPTFVGLLFTLWLLSHIWKVLQRQITIGQMVGQLLAGISLWDAWIISLTPLANWAWLALFAFAATLLAHRKIPGT